MANEQNEKTEEATPKRVQKERDKGHISKSQDMTSSLVLTIGLSLIFAFGPSMLEKLKSMLYRSFTELNPNNISESDVVAIMGPYFTDYVSIIALFFALLVAGTIFVLRMQTGALFAKEALKPSLDKFKPSSMIKNLVSKFNLFKPKQMVEFLKSLFKLIIVAFVGIKVITKRKEELFSLLGADPSTGFAVMGSVIFELLFTICIILIILGFFDKKYQDWEYAKSIKMSKQEVKDEMKNTEGDPKIKGKIRSFQIKMMQQKMMANVKESDVVVVNPTHYAVALKYDTEKAPAPMVVAKGVDFIAFKIREIAKNNNVPIIENKPLARSLYKMVEVNQMIPQELYVAVAEILQYVYLRRNN